MKLEAKKLELISASGVWKGKCYKVQGTDNEMDTLNAKLGALIASLNNG